MKLAEHSLCKCYTDMEKAKLNVEWNEDSCNCTAVDMVKVEKYGKQLPWILSAFIATVLLLYISTIRLWNIESFVLWYKESSCWNCIRMIETCPIRKLDWFNFSSFRTILKILSRCDFRKTPLTETLKMESIWLKNS